MEGLWKGWMGTLALGRTSRASKEHLLANDLRHRKTSFEEDHMSRISNLKQEPIHTFSHRFRYILNI